MTSLILASCITCGHWVAIPRRARWVRIPRHRVAVTRTVNVTETTVAVPIQSPCAGGACQVPTRQMRRRPFLFRRWR